MVATVLAFAHFTAGAWEAHEGGTASQVILGKPLPCLAFPVPSNTRTELVTSLHGSSELAELI